MMMPKNVIKQNWQAIKNEIRKNWSSLSEQDLEKSKGNMQSVSKLVEKKYDQEQVEIAKALEIIIEKFGHSRRPIYRTNTNKPVYRQDFRSPTHH